MGQITRHGDESITAEQVQHSADGAIVDWHALATEEVLARLGVTEQGLTTQQCKERIEVFGENRLPPPPRRSSFRRFAAQLDNALIYVLLCSAGVTVALGHPTDSAVIFGVVFINAVIGFVQEGKAESAIEAIRNMLSLKAVVMRDGVRMEVMAESLVPGDIVLIASGDKVPADLRLLSARNLTLQEAALTGESVPSTKSCDPIDALLPLGDRTCMAFSGTLVASGQGRGVVVVTGQQTEMGKIGTLLMQVGEMTTPLMRQLDQFGRQLSWGILAASIGLFLFGYLVHHMPLDEMFLAAVGVAVAAIPEGLPAVMTITLAIGVQRMARRNAIVRRLPAVETLGAVTIVCTDKTGTLTRNEMTVKQIVTAQSRVEVGGVGYVPQGDLTMHGRRLDVVPGSDIDLLVRAGKFCNDAQIRLAGNQWIAEGDPTEAALITVAMKMEAHRNAPYESLQRVDTVPFESGHRFMATLHISAEDQGLVLIKGAPEAVIKLCRSQRKGDSEQPIDMQSWESEMQSMMNHGLRVLAIAQIETVEIPERLEMAEHAGNFVLLGMLGMIDPPREESIAAVRQCQEAGIRVKMITGDHVDTARAIAEQIGISSATSTTGVSIEAADDQSLKKLAWETDVFARVSPEHKLRLVKALQAMGAVVSMTGDGANDAPALKQADIGVAMGRNGTEAAKDAAEIVLADDNFASIAHAVEEGRKIHDNLKKSITFILPTNVGMAMSVVVAIFMGMAPPITAVQILWVNMVSAVTLALALSFEAAEPSIMKRPPRPVNEPLISGYLLWRVCLVSFLMVLGTLGIYKYILTQAGVVEARTAAVNTLVMIEMLYLLSSRSFRESVFTITTFTGNPAIWISITVLMLLQLLFVNWSTMNQLFGTSGIQPIAWLMAFALAILAMVIIELEKRLLSRGV